MTFSSWDKTKEYLENNIVDAVVLDAKGQLTADDDVSEAHLIESFAWVKAAKIPYAIYTAYTDELSMLKQQIAEGRVFTKGKHKKEDVFNFLKKEIAQSPKMKYPEPFSCFGGDYLDLKYQELLMNVVLVLQNDDIKNAENFLFNPIRMILENVFRTINEVDEKVLPYALVNFEKQIIGLANCSKYLNGMHVSIRGDSYSGRKVLSVHISQQIQSIIGICHPASHEIQKYSSYTFKSVLWAIFDVLIWLKEFIDERK